MRENKTFFTFAFSLANVNYGVWTGPKKSKVINLHSELFVERGPLPFSFVRMGEESRMEKDRAPNINSHVTQSPLNAWNLELSCGLMQLPRTRDRHNMPKGFL